MIPCRGVRKSFSNLNDIGAAACSVGSGTRSSVSLVLERYAHVNVDELRHTTDALPWAGGNSEETLPGRRRHHDYQRDTSRGMGVLLAIVAVVPASRGACTRKRSRRMRNMSVA
jgi:hypothetical protein